MFAYLLSTPSLEKRYLVYCKTPRFREESKGYALELGPTSKEELLEWGKQFNSCLAVADNLLIAKAIAIYQARSGLFWLKNNEAFFKLPVDCLWPVPQPLLTEFFQAGFKTIGSLQQIPLEALRLRLGELGEKIFSYCRGEYSETINATPPFWEGRFSSESLEKTFAKLQQQLPAKIAQLWFLTEEKSLDFRPEKFGKHSLLRALKSLWPWQTLVVISWDSPPVKQGNLFDFNLPQALYSLLAQESGLKLGLTPNRRELVRQANFVWGFEFDPYLAITHNN